MPDGTRTPSFFGARAPQNTPGDKTAATAQATAKTASNQALTAEEQSGSEALPSATAKVLLTGPALKVARLTDRLRDVIAEETKLLEARNPRDAQKLHGEKARLIVEYREALGALKQNDRVLGGKDSPERSHMRNLTDTLRDALRDHARIVLRLKSVAEGLVRSVGEEVNKRNQHVVGYGANAATQRPKSAMPTSLAFNQII